MKKILLQILSITLSYHLCAQPSADFKETESELPSSIKFVDSNNDGIITLSEAKSVFDQYINSDKKQLKIELVDEIETVVLELVTFLEGIDCTDLKRNAATKRFIEIYYNNKFIKLDENNPNMGFKLSSSDTEIVSPPIIPVQKTQTEFFDKYFTVSTQLITLHQRQLSQNSKDRNVANQPWAPQTMVIFDLPIEFKPWKNAVINVTPEYAGGNAIGNAVGMGGYVNGIYGMSMPLPYIFRAQFSQVIDIKKEKSSLRGLEFTAGQIYLPDMMDYNAYSGDPFNDFLNYSHILSSAWDAAGNVFGYTYGTGVRLNFAKSQLNFAAVAVNKTPSGAILDNDIKNGHSFNLQYVRRFKFGNKSGSIRAQGFYNRSLSGVYNNYSIDSISNTAYFPDSLKTYHAKYGFAVDADIAMNDNLGLFSRLSWNDGKSETMHFTEVDNSICVGLVYSMGKYRRPNDKLGIAASMNGLSKDHKTFLENGGSGFMLGDGSLNYKNEMALEVFYNLNIIKYCTISLNYQYIVNQGYNSDRGNGSFIGYRINFSF